MKKLITTALFVLSSVIFADVGIATGSKEGTNFVFGSDIQNTCKAGQKISVVESNGSLDNIAKIMSDKQTQYGVVQVDALEYMKLQDPEGMSKIVQIFPLFQSEIHLIARNDSGINNINQLNGKRVIIGPNGSGTWVTSQIIQAKTGIQWKATEETPKNGLMMLLAGKADAMFFVAGKPIGSLKDLGGAGTGVVHLVNLKHQSLDGFYKPTMIPSQMYAWESKAVSTYAVPNVLATFNYKNAMMQGEITKLVQCIVNHVDDLQMNGHPKWKEVDPLDIDKINWPAHPAAKKIVMSYKKK